MKRRKTMPECDACHGAEEGITSPPRPASLITTIPEWVASNIYHSESNPSGFVTPSLLEDFTHILLHDACVLHDHHPFHCAMLKIQLFKDEAAMTSACRSLASAVSGGNVVEESVLLPLSNADGQGVLFIARDAGMKRCGVVTCRRSGGGWDLCVKGFVAPAVGIPPSASFTASSKTFSACCYWCAYCGGDPLHLFKVFRPLSPWDAEKPYQFSNFLYGALPKEGWVELLSSVFSSTAITPLGDDDGTAVVVAPLPFHEHAWLDHGGWSQLYAFGIGGSFLYVFHRVGPSSMLDSGLCHQQLVVYIRDSGSDCEPAALYNLCCHVPADCIGANGN